jgi:hypothetical protein
MTVATRVSRRFQEDVGTISEFWRHARTAQARGDHHPRGPGKSVASSVSGKSKPGVVRLCGWSTLMAPIDSCCRSGIALQYRVPRSRRVPSRRRASSAGGPNPIRPRRDRLGSAARPAAPASRLVGSVAEGRCPRPQCGAIDLCGDRLGQGQAGRVSGLGLVDQRPGRELRQVGAQRLLV